MVSYSLKRSVIYFCITVKLREISLHKLIIPMVNKEHVITAVCVIVMVASGTAV